MVYKYRNRVGKIQDMPTIPKMALDQTEKEYDCLE